MHEKDFAVDGDLLRSGSANWSTGGLRRQDSVAISTPARTDVARFKKKLDEMWACSDNVELK